MKTLSELITEKTKLQSEVYKHESNINLATAMMERAKKEIEELNIAIQAMTTSQKTYEDYEKLFTENTELYEELADYLIWEDFIDLEGNYHITEMCWFNETYRDENPLALIGKLDKDFDPDALYYYHDDTTIYSCDDKSPLKEIMSNVIEFIMTHELDDEMNRILNGDC